MGRWRGPPSAPYRIFARHSPHASRSSVSGTPWRAADTVIDARNRALLAVAYDTLLRRGELVALQVADIVEEADGAANVLVRRSKTDAEGRGATLYLAPDSVALVRAWRERSAVTEGRLFRSLNRGALGERLDASGEVKRRRS